MDSTGGEGLRFAQVSADRGIAPGSTKGAAQHLRGIAAGLVALGHRVETFSARNAEGDYVVPVRPIAELAQAVGSFDVIYERYSLGHRAGLDLARFHGLPFVLEVNAPLLDEAAAHRPGTVADGDAQIESALLAEADLVITVSQELTHWVGQCRSGPTVTLANGFEPEWFAPPAQAPATGPERDLAFIGHPKPWHGADRILDVIAGLDRLGRPSDALIVGGGPGVQELAGRAAERGLADRVEITGPLPPAQASAHLTRGRIGLAPYRPLDRFYFCPLKVVDYMAAGLAIVASDIGDVQNLVRDSAVLVDPADDLGLVDAVADLLADDARRAELGAAARARAFGSMTWTHVAARTLDAIESTGLVVDRLGRGPSGPAEARAGTP